MKKAYAFAATLTFSLLFLVTAEAGENTYVCGTRDGSGLQFFSQTRSQSQSTARALGECRRGSNQPRTCMKPLCKRVWLPTKVSELPAATQARIRAQSRAQARAPKGERSAAQRDREWLNRNAGNTTGGGSRTDAAGRTYYTDGTWSETDSTGAMRFSDGTRIDAGDIRRDSVGVNYGSKKYCRTFSTGTVCENR